MGQGEWHSTSIDYSDVLSAFRSQRTLPLGLISTLDPEVMDYHHSFMQRHQDDSISTFVFEDTLQKSHINIGMGKYVDFFFVYSGVKQVALTERISQLSDLDVVIFINAPGCSLRQEPGEQKRALSFMVYPEVLIEEYGLKIDALPTHIAAALTRRDHRPAILKLSLPPRVRISLESLYATTITGPTFEKYVYAKAEELVCEMVALLNQLTSLKLSSFYASNKHALEQKIESAAYIYRQNVGRHIPIGELCRKVGINRNVLTSGFKDIFGQSPAEYARIHNMEWAKSQIIEGHHSIKSLSEIVGYSNVSAFSRAYSSHFGIPPTMTTKKLMLCSNRKHLRGRRHGHVAMTKGDAFSIPEVNRERTDRSLESDNLRSDQIQQLEDYHSLLRGIRRKYEDVTLRPGGCAPECAREPMELSHALMELACDVGRDIASLSAAMTLDWRAELIVDPRSEAPEAPCGGDHASSRRLAGVHRIATRDGPSKE